MEKEEEIFESNKLIALFMGYTEDDIQAEDWCGCNVLVECQFTGIKELTGADYHSKWDWLMPVVEKSLNDKSVQLLLPMNGVPDSVIPYINAVGDFKRGLIKADINLVYEGVIKFIKWYNFNKQPIKHISNGE